MVKVLPKTAMEKFSCLKRVKFKAGHWLQWELRVIICQANRSQLRWIWAGNLLCSISSTSGWSPEHFFILLSWNTEVFCWRYKLHTTTQILNSFSCWIFLLGLRSFVTWMLHNAWMSNCRCFELSIINYTTQICLYFGNQNLLCHLNCWWTSFTYLLTIVLMLKSEECFHFCGVACWLLSQLD